MFKVGDEVIVTEAALELRYHEDYLGVNVIMDIDIYEVSFEGHPYVCYIEHIRKATKLDRALK